MKIACISFTSSGKKISNTIKTKLELKVYKNYKVVEIDKNTFKDKVSNHMKDIFSDYDALIFICSTGIALRLIAPYIESKLKDPAVIVVDDLGKYSISLLSGHIGGANELATKVSTILKNQAIITTASDNRGIDAVDTFAKRYNFYIESMNDAKNLTSLMVEGKKINLISEVDVDLRYDNYMYHTITNSTLIEVTQNDKHEGSIVVSSTQNIGSYIDTKDKPLCILRPRNLNIGIGCRRGKSKQEILKFIKTIFKQNNLSLKSIRKIGTIDVKKDEVGIIEASKQLDCDIEIFTKKDIENVQEKFNKSKFVESKVGVTSVCEPCAYLLGKEMIVYKTISNGITIAVSRSDLIG